MASQVDGWQLTGTLAIGFASGEAALGVRAGQETVAEREYVGAGVERKDVVIHLLLLLLLRELLQLGTGSCC